MYNIMLRCVHKATVAVENQEVLDISPCAPERLSMCLHACSVAYPACNMHVSFDFLYKFI